MKKTIPSDNEPDPRDAPVSKSEAALASSANSRINVPLNLANWRHLPQDTIDDLTWFHQHALESGLSWEDCCEALNYERTTVWRCLKGTYEGNWTNVTNSIRSYRKIIADRLAIKNAAFRETRITRLVTGALSYAMANNSITLILGESRQGKTASGKYWRDQNNHGRTVFVTAPAYGSTKALLKEIAQCLGINRNAGNTNMHESILRAFNTNRMLIVDEAHRLLPKDAGREPVMIEVLRDLHDRTGCGLALLATQRFAEGVKRSSYMFEQVLGRIGMPVQLPRDMEWADIAPITEQFIRKVPTDLRSELLKIANDRGRLGILCEILKFSARIADKTNSELTAETVKTAIATRYQMMGEVQYAKK